MKRLFFIDDIAENKISYWHILLFLASLPFDRFYSEIVLISFSIHTLLHFNKGILRCLLNKQIFLLQSIFIVTVIGIFYSANKTQAVEDITKQLSIFIFPLIFSSNKINIRKYSYQLLLLFSLVCTFTIVYLYIDALWTIHYYQLPLLSLLSPAFNKHNFSQPIEIHATYLSLYVALSLVFMLQQLIGKKEKEAKIFIGVCCIILGAGLIQLASRSVFFAMLIILNVVFPFMLFTAIKDRLKYIVIGSFCSGLIIAAIFNISTFKEHYFNDVKADLSNSKNSETFAQAGPRLERWKVAWVIVKQSPVTGHGSGTEISLLKEQYFSKKMYSSYLHELNAHNQYISLLIKSGIVGLLVYLYVLFVGFRQAIIKRDILFFSFLLLIVTASISENILDVNKGIFFYSFFFSFFAITTSKPLLRPKEITFTIYNCLDLINFYNSVTEDHLIYID